MITSDNAISFIKDQWLELILFVIGIIFTLRQFGKPRPKLSYLVSSWPLIRSSSGILLEDLTVRYRDEDIDRLTSSDIVIWNEGNETLRHNDITKKAPLHLKIKDGKILQANVISVTRDEIAFHLKASVSPNSIDFDFEFLEGGDGAYINLLHTSSTTEVLIAGTVIDLKQGVCFRGEASLYMDSKPHSKSDKRTSIRYMASLFRVKRNLLVFFIAYCVVPLAAALLWDKIESPDATPAERIRHGSVNKAFFATLGIVGLIITTSSYLSMPRRLPHKALKRNGSNESD